MKLPGRSRMIRDAAEKGGQKWYLEILIFLGVFLVASFLEGIPQAIGQLLLIAQTGELFPKVYPDWFMIVSLFSTALMTVAVILFCKLVQKRDLPSVGFCRKGAVKEYLIGAAAGTVLFGAATLICVLTGSLSLTAQRFSVGVWILYLIGFLIQGMSEEVLCRGYFMVSVARRNHLALAVFLNSFLFALLHVLNPGVTALALFNVMLFGVLASLYVLRRGNLWGACAAHSLWNFVQGNVFGVSVSGTGSGASPLAATQTDGKWIWNGGEFGAEGGLAVTIVLILGILAVLFLMKDRKNEETTEPEPSRTSEPNDPNQYDPFGA